MATTTVILSNTRLQGVNGLVAGSIVGLDPWNDSDVNTYTEVTASFRTSVGAPDALQYAVVDLALGVDVGSLISISLDADVTCTNDAGAGLTSSIDFGLYDSAGDNLTSFYEDTPLGFSTVTSSATTFGDASPEIFTTYLLPVLLSGTLRVGRLLPADLVLPADITVRCHRLVLTIEYEPAVALPASGVGDLEDARRLFFPT